MDRKLLFVASTGAHIRHFHLPYLQQLRDEGWTVHAACRREGTIPCADQVIHVPFKKQMFSPVNLEAVRILRTHIRKENYEAVIVHTSLAAFFTRLAVLGRPDRPKVINMVHGYLFDEQTPRLKRGLLLAAEKLTAPVTDLLITMNRFDWELAQNTGWADASALFPVWGWTFRSWRPGAPVALRSFAALWELVLRILC